MIALYDYDARYRHLKAAGFRGWAGAQYDRGVAGLMASLDRLDRAGHLPPPPARVLELGCGNGSAAALLAPKGYEVHGIDISPTAIAWAEERFATAGLAGTFHEGDVRTMPGFADYAFDLVLDSACLHCLIGEDRTRCLAEVRRILRPNGVFIVSSMCGLPKSAEAQARFDAGHLLEDGRPHRTLKPLADLMAELAEAGIHAMDHWIAGNAWWDHATIVCLVSG